MQFWDFFEGSKVRLLRDSRKEGDFMFARPLAGKRMSFSIWLHFTLRKGPSSCNGLYRMSQGVNCLKVISSFAIYAFSGLLGVNSYPIMLKKSDLLR